MARSISPYERYGEAKPLTDSTLIEHTFNASETVSGLAHRYYDDWRLWRLVADRNNIADVRRIAAGTVLLIPERPLEGGGFESL
ncbi:MAG: hypothetical protein MSG64_07545 [Pyrinomonadaceae bacterium MAG19_C2-C3]|nr:hypothetical protein [Pyrinomonadaceae bacterium MAG19_C2-C3]